MKLIAAIALGGAVGAVARHQVAVWTAQLLGHGFPFGTLVVNVVGSLAMGLLIEASALKITLTPEVRAMLVTGVLGAFTTFSTFSLDAAFLYEKGELMKAALYIALSVVASIGALFAGLWIVRTVTA